MYKILSVDDSRIVRMQVRKAFAAYDVEIIEAENGEVGLEQAYAEMPDLILLDITMPVMTGEEMLERLRADDVIGKIPVIMLSADLSKQTMVKMAKLGSNDYIPKPFTSEIVTEKAEKFIKRKLQKASDHVVEEHNKVIEEGSSSKHSKFYFIPEDDHLTISFPEFSIDVIREINKEFAKYLSEAITNRIMDIFVDLSKVDQVDIALAACVHNISEECCLREARCHILAYKGIQDEISLYPCCEGLNYYLPPEAGE